MSQWFQLISHCDDLFAWGQEGTVFTVHTKSTHLLGNQLLHVFLALVIFYSGVVENFHVLLRNLPFLSWLILRDLVKARNCILLPRNCLTLMLKTHVIECWNVLAILHSLLYILLNWPWRLEGFTFIVPSFLFCESWRYIFWLSYLGDIFLIEVLLLSLLIWSFLRLRSFFWKSIILGFFDDSQQLAEFLLIFGLS